MATLTGTIYVGSQIDWRKAVYYFVEKKVIFYNIF